MISYANCVFSYRLTKHSVLLINDLLRRVRTLLRKLALEKKREHLNKVYRVCFLPFARMKVKQNSFLRVFVDAKISPEYQLLPNLQQSLSYLKNWASLPIKLMFKHVPCVPVIFHFKENDLKSGFHHITTRQLFD